MHANAFTGEAQEPFHRCAGKMGSAWRRIDVSANSRADDSAPAVDEIAVKTGVMIGILFHHAKMSSWGLVSAFPGRNRSVRHNLLANHQIGALFGNRHHDVGTFRRRLGEELLIHLQWSLLRNHLARFLHFWPECLSVD